MDSHHEVSIQTKRHRRRRRQNGISYAQRTPQPPPPPNLNSYFYKPSNPIRVREKIDEICLDQMHTWERIRQLEGKIEKKRKRMTTTEQSTNFSGVNKRTNAHERNIEELIQALSKDEAKTEVQLVGN